MMTQDDRRGRITRKKKTPRYSGAFIIQNMPAQCYTYCLSLKNADFDTLK